MKKKNEMLIMPTLDVGCALNYEGDVNVDLYTEETIHRSHARSKYVFNPKRIPNFVKADINALPFKKDCFNTVHCSHLLEHDGVDVHEACKELLRITKYTVVISVPHWLSPVAKRDKEHIRIFRSRIFHGIFRNYYHHVHWEWALWPFPPRPINIIVTVRKGQIRRV